MPGTRLDNTPLVLHVIHHLVVGGMENGLVNLINRMPASRFRHAIACIEDYSDFRNRLTRSDVEVFALHRSRIGVWKLRRELYRLCRTLRPAIVHTRGLSGLDALPPARLAGVRRCVHGEHGWNVDNVRGEDRKAIWLRRIHAPLVNRYVTVSQDLQRYLIQEVGIRASRINQIYNGVDTERFSPRATKPAGVLPSNFLDDGLVIIGTVGRIQPVKDQATLVRAVAELRRRYPDLASRVRLAVVGDGPLLGSLRDLVRALDLTAASWLPGALSNIPEVLSALDVFVLPSIAEGISNTILEAMSSGLPIVATAVGGNVELVQEASSGRFFNPGDSGALAEILAEYVARTSLRDAQGVAARRIAVERFGLDAMIGNYEALYEALCFSRSNSKALTPRTR